MKKYKALFFDLDHTIWDFDLNSREALEELYLNNHLEAAGVPEVENFLNVYRKVNYEMWDEYHNNKINKEFLRSGRFRRTLQTFNIHDDFLVEKLSCQYLEICPLKKNLFPGAIHVLNELSHKYSLHIITNGFKEVQYRKIKNSGIENFFTHIHISEEIGFKKPEPEIFHHAVQMAGTLHEKCLMIGDNPDTDILGAENAGIDHVLFNPNNEKIAKKVMKEINNLSELLTFL